MNQGISSILALCKWPIALLFATLFPATAILLWEEIIFSLREGAYFWPLFWGAVTYILIWYYLIRKSSISFLSTLEHEITHCIFAWLTFNRVTGLKATLRSGGHMTYEGSGNWLLTIAPYFFPTSTIGLLFLAPYLDFVSVLVIQAVIGASIAYHATSTWVETHHAQTDLKEVGFLFSFLFLPTANLLSFALIFADLRSGWHGVVLAIKNLSIAYIDQVQIFSRIFGANY